MSRRVVLLAALVLILAAGEATAACMNKFVNRAEGPRQVVTLLTGKYTFQEAQVLAEAINGKKAPPLQWVDDGGKVLATQWGELKVVRPMPVGCDGKPSGVVMIATFATVSKPSKKMNVKFDSSTTVAFDEQ
jgi:hypothetical protein